MAEVHAQFHLAVLFLALCLVIGAASKFIIPSWIPYTVSVLLLSILLGLSAFYLETRASCPMNALYKYDRDHDEKASGARPRSRVSTCSCALADPHPVRSCVTQVSRDEWREFVCEGCVPASECITFSCGDGSADPSTCEFHL